MEETGYEIKLPVFEGPLDLLLHLIREHKMDIYDIQISLITQQYLEYLEMMKELDLEIAGDFIVMASTLIHIKSRMLLPIEETADTDEPEDPRLELVMKLLEYKSFKDAALGLKEKEEEWSEIIPRTPLPEEKEEEEPADLSLFDLNLFDLLSAFNKLLEKAPPEVRVITRETLTVKDKMNMIIESLKAHDALRFESLFKDDITLPHFLVTFIALLELIKLGLARVYQKEGFATIWIISPEAELERDSLESAPSRTGRKIQREAPRMETSGVIRDIVRRAREDKARAMQEIRDRDRDEDHDDLEISPHGSAQGGRQSLANARAAHRCLVELPATTPALPEIFSRKLEIISLTRPALPKKPTVI